MNNNTHNGDHRQPPSAAPGHPSLPPQYQHHLQQLHSQHPSAAQDPQLAFLLANATAAAAARGQPTPGAVPGHLGVGNNNLGAGLVHPGRFGSNNEHHGNPGAMPNAQSAAAQLFEEQILQRASALRAEALMQQRQQSQQAAHTHSQQHQMNPQNLQIQAALQAFQQQQQLSSLNGAAPTPSSNGNTSPTITTDLIQQQQEKVLMARAQALRDLGLGGSAFEKLDMNRLIQHRQHTQQQQQRAQFGLEHEIERVRQAQRLAAMGSPKPSVPGGPPVPPDGAGAVLSSVSAAAAASEAVQKALPSSNENSERGIPSASKSKPVIPTPPKPPAEVVKTETGATASKPSPESSSSSAGPTASGTSTPQPKAATAGGRTGSPEQTKATKETAGAGAAAAAAVRCKTKEELRKNPGTVIVPCRARGMPMDHNFISAYFVISEDAKHGENLVCSYYACRNGGIKFRYCAYCMAPVAKRNFSRRHDHGMSKNKGAAKIKDDEEEEEDDDTLGGSENTGSDKGSTSVVAMPSSLTLKRPKEVPSSDDGSKRQRLEPAPTISTEAKVKDIAEDVSSKRRSMWNDLLAKRPRAKDPNTLSSWLNEVLAVSDMEFPLEQVGTNMDHPFGKLLLNELPKLAKPAATPTEDEAAMDTMDTSNDSPENSDSASKDNSQSGSNNTATNTNTADTVVGNEKTPTASSKDEKDTASAGETAKDETTETKKPTEEDSSSKEQETKDPDTPVRDNTKTESTSDNNNNGSNSSSSKGVKLLGQKSKLSPKKSIIAGVEEESRKEKKKEDEGFAGSFADWRDRKKGKSLKKGSGSLRK